MESIQQEVVFGEIKISTMIEAIDQLNATGYILRGVSDSLLALSEQSHDYQDVMRMFSDVTMHQSLVVNEIEEFMEKESRVNLNETVRNPELEPTYLAR